MVRTQAARRDETRERLLAAAATVFAQRGVEGASVDAIAAAADRTSGSLYAHFGNKEGLLVDLLDSWMNDVAVAAAAELETAESIDERLAALWRNFADPPGGGEPRWIQLEHELWCWATRPGNEHGRDRVGARYREACDQLAPTLRAWMDEGVIEGGQDADALAALVIGLMIGFEMQRRVGAGVPSDDVVVAGLKALVAAEPSAPKRGSRRRR
jgi:AcrR family transcriptional regulator